MRPLAVLWGPLAGHAPLVATIDSTTQGTSAPFLAVLSLERDAVVRDVDALVRGRHRQRADVALVDLEVDERVAARGGWCRTPPAPSRSPPPIALASASLRHQIRSSSVWRSPPSSAARSPSVSVRSTARERRAVRSTSMPTSTPSASATSARSPEWERLKRRRRRPAARACRAAGRRTRRRSGSSPSPRAEHDPQRRAGDDPARARPGRLAARPARARRREQRLQARRRAPAAAPARPARPRLAQCVIDSPVNWQGCLTRGGRTPGTAGVGFLFLQISGRSGPPSRSSE